jgi:hypothetical protein
MEHLAGEPFHGARDSHSGRRRARFVEHDCQLLVAVLKLNPADDRLAISRAEALERPLVSLDVFGPDRLVKRRRPFVDYPSGELDVIGASIPLPDDVANTVHDRLTQIRLEGSLVSGVKGVQFFYGSDDGVLNEINGVLRAASEGRQPPMCPAPQGRDTALEQPVERVIVTLPDTFKEIGRGLR